MYLQLQFLPDSNHAFLPIATFHVDQQFFIACFLVLKIGGIQFILHIQVIIEMRITALNGI